VAAALIETETEDAIKTKLIFYNKRKRIDKNISKTLSKRK